MLRLDTVIRKRSAIYSDPIFPEHGDDSALRRSNMQEAGKTVKTSSLSILAIAGVEPYREQNRAKSI